MTYSADQPRLDESAQPRQGAELRRTREAGDVTIEIVVKAPDASATAELRQRQLAAVARLLRRAYELQQRRPRAA